MAVKKQTFFINSCNIEAEVNIERFLLPFLSPTAKGTNYWDSPTEANLVGLSDREIVRIVSQVEEISKILKENKNLIDIGNNEINFLDVGTGNGMVPRLLSAVNNSINATAIDPFLHGGHKTSWQRSNSEENLNACIKLWKSSHTLNCSNKSSNKYVEYKRYLDEHLNISNKKYNVVYCKAIEHVPNWSEFADQLCSALEVGGLLIIKHRSFYSYLGPHRYSTTGIPWGHCLLNDDEYEEYAKQFHSERSDIMCDFYKNGLSYPRMTVSELIQRCNFKNLDLVSLNLTKPKYSKQQFNLLKSKPPYIDLILRKNIFLSYEEITSGLITLVLQKQ